MVQDLVELAQAGDLDAFAALVNRVSDRLYAIAFRILRDAGLAEDALQNALLIVWRQLPTLREPASFEAWARRLLINACYAEAKRRRTWTSHIRVLPIDGPAAQDDLLSVAERDTLERAFRRLSIEQRTAFVLHHYVGLSTGEVAEAIGTPPGTARSRLHYATRILRAAVEADSEPVASEGRMA